MKFECVASAQWFHNSMRLFGCTHLQITMVYQMGARTIINRKFTRILFDNLHAQDSGASGEKEEKEEEEEASEEEEEACDDSSSFDRCCSRWQTFFDFTRNFLRKCNNEACCRGHFLLL